MRDTILDSITRLLRFQRAPEKLTSKFEQLKHNRDILPKLQIQIETILEAYGKFEPIVYDCQGIHDDGSDISIRLRPHAKDPQQICFQVKSFDDLEKKTYLQELKAQRDDSTRMVRGMLHYFVVLCTDGNTHKDKIRNIVSAFRGAERTEVIEPAYAYTFINFPKPRIDALVKRFMDAEDYVLRQALESLDEPSPSARALALFMTVRSALSGQTRFSLHQLSQEGVLRSIYRQLRDRQEELLANSQADVQSQLGDEQQTQDDEWEDEEEPIRVQDFEDQVAVDLDLLENIAETSSSSGEIVLQREHLLALVAVVLDASVRYEYDEEQLINYMFNLMGVND
jgi:hypothetical protein